jgi:hypothetical protein
MDWCCSTLEEHVQRGAQPGFHLVYHYSAKTGKWFILQYGSPEPEAGVLSAVRIRFCPWCGSNLEEYPKAEAHGSDVQ